MKRIANQETFGILTCVYGETGLRDAESVARCVERLARLEGFEAKYIALRDLEHGADEGNASRQLRPDAPRQDIVEALLARTYDRLFLSGSFEGARVGVGVDLRTYELMLSVPGGRTGLAEKLAGALSAQ